MASMQEARAKVTEELVERFTKPREMEAVSTMFNRLAVTKAPAK